MTIDTKISDQVHRHLDPQVFEIYRLAVRYAIAHQMLIPDSHIAKLAAEREPRGLRIFSDENPSFDEFLIQEKAGAVMHSKELPSGINLLLQQAFDCFNDLLNGRYEEDQEKVWGAKSRAFAFKRELQKEVRKDRIPKQVLVLFEVAEQIATSKKKLDWEPIAGPLLHPKKPDGPRLGA